MGVVFIILHSGDEPRSIFIIFYPYFLIIIEEGEGKKEVRTL